MGDMLFFIVNNRLGVTITMHAIKRHFLIWMTTVRQPTKRRCSCVSTLKCTFICVYLWTRQRIHNTLIVVDRYLRLMGDKTIPDSAEPRLESFYPPWVAGIDLPHQGVVDSYNHHSRVKCCRKSCIQTRSWVSSVGLISEPNVCRPSANTVMITQIFCFIRSLTKGYQRFWENIYRSTDQNEQHSLMWSLGTWRNNVQISWKTREHLLTVLCFCHATCSWPVCLTGRCCFHVTDFWDGFHVF